MNHGYYDMRNDLIHERSRGEAEGVCPPPFGICGLLRRCGPPGRGAFRKQITDGTVFRKQIMDDKADYKTKKSAFWTELYPFSLG